jgi:hypothetical protein
VIRRTTAALAYGGKERDKLRDERLHLLPQRGEFVRFGVVQGKHGLVGSGANGLSGRDASTDVDALSIEQDGIPDSGRSVSLSVNLEKLN